MRYQYLRRVHAPVVMMVCVLNLLCGCVSVPKVKPTASALNPNSLAKGSDITESASGGWPAADWWKSYHDPQLNRLIDRSIAGNPRIAAAAERIQMAQAVARVSKSALAPTVDAAAEFDRTRFSEDFYLPPAIDGHDLFTPLWSNNIGLTASYTFDFWGRDRAAFEAALDAVQVGECEAQNARLLLEGAILRNYAQLSYTYEIQDHDNAILDAQTRILDLAQRRLKAGLGTELEIQQANTAVSATRAQLVVVADQLSILRNQLAALSGAGPGAGEALVRPVMKLDDGISLPTQIPAELIGRRPDVRAERWRVEAAAKQVAVSKAAFYPNINLKGSLGFLGIGFGQLIAGNSINATLGPAITLPIFEGGRLRAGLDVRISEYDLAVDAYNATVVEALHQVADQLSRLNSLESLQRRREESLQFARRAQQLAVIAFRAGLTDYNNVLSTEDAFDRAEIAMADVRLQQVTAFAALDEALGGGLVNASDTTNLAAPGTELP